MQFTPLTSLSQLDDIDQKSKEKLQFIYKHSTRCGICIGSQRLLLSELRNHQQEEFDIYYLDLLTYRPVSNAIAERYDVEHESPQLLVIRDGKCIWFGSHSEVSIEEAISSIG